MTADTPSDPGGTGPADGTTGGDPEGKGARRLMRSGVPERPSDPGADGKAAPSQPPRRTAPAGARPPARAGASGTGGAAATSTAAKDGKGTRPATSGSGSSGSSSSGAGSSEVASARGGTAARPSASTASGHTRRAVALPSPGSAADLPGDAGSPDAPADTAAQLPAVIEDTPARTPPQSAQTRGTGGGGKPPASGGRSPRDARPPQRNVSRTAPMSLAAIHAAMAGHREGHDPLGIALAVVVRVASVVWLAGAVVVWMRLIGYGSDAITASWHAPDGPWISTAVAAVVMPVISIGLWLAGSWGIVLWSSALLAAVVFTIVAPSSVPFGILALIANLLALAVAGGLASARAWSRRDPHS